MIVGNIKGYDICNITKRKVEKEGFLLEIEKIDSSIKEEILKVLENKGYVYGLKKKNILKAVYLFDNTKNENNKKVLCFNKSIHTEDSTEEIEKFEKIIIEELKEKITWGEFMRGYLGRYRNTSK